MSLKPHACFPNPHFQMRKLALLREFKSLVQGRRGSKELSRAFNPAGSHSYAFSYFVVYVLPVRGWPVVNLGARQGGILVTITVNTECDFTVCWCILALSPQ